MRMLVGVTIDNGVKSYSCNTGVNFPPSAGEIDFANFAVQERLRGAREVKRHTDASCKVITRPHGQQSERNIRSEKSVDDVMMCSIAAGGNDHVGLFITRLACQLGQVLRVSTFVDLEVSGFLAEDLERTFEQTVRLATPRGRIEQNDNSHGCAREGCRVGGEKSRPGILCAVLIRTYDKRPFPVSAGQTAPHV